MQLAVLISKNLYYVPVLVALLGAGISAYTDFRWRKIKNIVTLPMIIFGWLWSLIFGGIILFLINVVLSFIIGFAPRLASIYADGDVKLTIGVAACLQPALNILFLLFLFMLMVLSSIYMRLKLYNFKLKPTLAAMKEEVNAELGGAKMIAHDIHGRAIEHAGAPVIFLALILCLVTTWGGLI